MSDQRDGGGYFLIGLYPVVIAFASVVFMVLWVIHLPIRAIHHHQTKARTTRPVVNSRYVDSTRTPHAAHTAPRAPQLVDPRGMSRAAYWFATNPSSPTPPPPPPPKFTQRKAMP